MTLVHKIADKRNTCRQVLIRSFAKRQDNEYVCGAQSSGYKLEHLQ